MKCSFKIEIFEGHPIITDGENIILLDTGAPSTIHISDSLTFCNQKYETSRNYMGLTVSRISEMLGKEISTLLGADVLSNYTLLLDYKNERIELDNGQVNFEGEEVAVSSFMGIPIIVLSIDGRRLKFFLDTGAKLSYLKEDLSCNYSPCGLEEDFYPGVGRFETNCYEISTMLGNDSFNVIYGNLPPLLLMTLALAGADGIIGYDFFKTFTVCLDLKMGRLKYSL